MTKEIPINRTRIPKTLVIFLILSLAFGYAAFFPSPTFAGGPMNISNRVFSGIVAAALLYYGGLMLVDYIKRRFGKNIAFRITDTGIYDNTGIYSCGEVHWNDIVALEIARALEVNVLVVKVHDPYKYLGGKNPLMRYHKKKTIKKWHTPILISQTKLDYDLLKLHEELSRLLNDHRVGLAMGS